MTRASTIRHDHIEYGFWLIFDSRGGLRMTRTEPSISRNERSMYVTATLPIALFQTPSLTAKLNVSNPDLPIPTINLQATAEAMRAALGVDIDLTIRTPE